MLLGLDLGTTNVKALVTDFSGKSVACGSCPVQLKFVGPDGVEQDIEEIWHATLTAIRGALRDLDSSAIRAIGVSSQGGALQLTDPGGKPVGPVTSWLDSRGQPFDRKLTGELGGEWFIEKIGHQKSGFAIGQLSRIRSLSPNALDGRARVAFVGDFIVQRLCGSSGHDGTSCSLTALYDPVSQEYARDVLQRIGISRAQVPPLCSPRRAVGGLLAEVAAQTGLSPGIPVSPAIHDQYASALATGAVQPGTVMVGTGTAWVLLAVTTSMTTPVTSSAFSCHHVVEGLWGQIVSLVNGGSALSWALKLTGLGNSGSAQIDSLLASTPPGSDGVRCWPLLAPGGSNGIKVTTHGRFSGLKLSHGPNHIIRSVLEGLACELARHLSFLHSANIPVKRLVLGGPGGASRVTPEIIADTTGLPVASVVADGGSPLGAAIIARGLLEHSASLADLAKEMMPAVRQTEPGPDAPVYRELLEDYVRFLPLTRI